MSAATIHAESVAAPDRARMRALMLGAIGVVYGDIGTSPLYTMKEVFGGHLPLTEHNILGILSLIVWSLMVVVTLKYVVVIMRADNRGQGGVLALSTLAQRDLGKAGAFVVGLLGMLGMALFTGDSLITPAISVLSAVEGLNVAAPSLEPYIIPVTLAVIGALFLIQSAGTETVGKLFGPIMCGWFGVLGILGLVEIAQHPFILRALLPVYALGFFYDHGFASFFVLGAVVLSVTGGEALYADMGHFGREAIRRAWLFFVMPCLILNYFGQGALLIAEPAAIKNPFYLLGPDFMMWPMLILATCATVIASQAVISGAFSLTQQAVQLGYLPRREIRHTSDHEIGQVYIPRNNWLLLTGVVILVLGFRSSSALASAYGISVVGAMTIDAILAFIVVTKLWRWSLAKAVPLFSLFLAIDLAFLAANATKIPDGGWFPLAIAGIVFTMMYVWRKGRRIVLERLYGGDRLTIEEFIAQRCRVFNNRVAGTAVYLASNPSVAPPTLMHSIKHFKVLHEHVVLLTVRFCDVPYKTLDARVEIEDLGEGFHRVQIFYGYMEKPDIMAALPLVERRGLSFDLMTTSFFVGRETLIPGDKAALNRLQEPIFIGMAKTAQSATDFFQLPPNRVVEMGAQVNI